MSHFSVLVVGEDPEEQLAPFHEFECTGKEEFIQEIDITENTREEYETGTERRYKLGDELIDPYLDRFYREPTDEDKKTVSMLGSFGFGGGLSYESRDWGDGQGYRPKVHFMPDGMEEVEVPRSQLQSFVEFAFEWYGYELAGSEEDIDITGKHKYGYILVNGDGVKIIDRTNPNKKWDWYELGGRWCGFFKVSSYDLIKKADMLTDEFAVGSHYSVKPKHDCDRCRKKHIDIGHMKTHAYLEAAERYKKLEAATAGIDPPPLTWGQLAEQTSDIASARETYRNHPWIRAISDAGIDHWGCPVESYKIHNGGKAAYVREAVDTALCTYSVLMDGKWYERGSMGWWGCASNEISKAEWAERFNELFDSLPGDTLLSVFDCHI